MRGFLSMLKNMNRPAGILMAIGLLLPLILALIGLILKDLAPQGDFIQMSIWSKGCFDTIPAVWLSCFFSAFVVDLVMKQELGVSHDDTKK